LAVILELKKEVFYLQKKDFEHLIILKQEQNGKSTAKKQGIRSAMGKRNALFFAEQKIEKR
jgi:hypothetical protein